MEIRRYDPQDLEALLAFHRRIFPGFPHKGDREYFEWEFDQNPLASSLGTYLLVWSDHRIVGQLATLRDRIRVADRWVDGIWLCDLVIDPANRGGPALGTLFRRTMRSSSLVLTTGITPRMVRIYEALKWTPGPRTRSKYFILRPSKLTAIAGTSAMAMHPSAAVRIASPFADRLLPATARALRRTLRPGSSGASITRVERLDSADDADLESLAMRCGVTQYRAASVLNWKFPDRPIGAQQIYVLRTPYGSLRAMIVLRWMCRPSIARWIEVADYIAAPEDGIAFDELARVAMTTAVEHDFDFVRFRLSRPEHVARLEPPLWLEHTRPIVDDLFAYSRDESTREVLATTPWHLTALAADRVETGRDEWPHHADVMMASR